VQLAFTLLLRVQVFALELVCVHKVEDIEMSRNDLRQALMSGIKDMMRAPVGYLYSSPASTLHLVYTSDCEYIVATNYE